MDKVGWKTSLFMVTFTHKEILEIGKDKKPDQKETIYLHKVTSSFQSDEADALPLEHRIYILEKIIGIDKNPMVIDKLLLAYAKAEGCTNHECWQVGKSGYGNRGFSRQ